MMVYVATIELLRGSSASGLDSEERGRGALIFKFKDSAVIRELTPEPNRLKMRYTNVFCVLI